MLLSEAEFEEITPRYFMLRLKGLRDAQQQQYRNEWERTRWLAMFVLMPHSKKRIKPQDLARFPWESQKKVNAALIEMLQNNKEKLDKLTPIKAGEGDALPLKEFKKLFSWYLRQVLNAKGLFLTS